MNRQKHITSFYIETIVMILIFVMVILILTQVFGASRKESVEAMRLTDAVCLAENAQTAVTASGSASELAELLDNGNETLREESGQTVIDCFYDRDLKPSKEGAYRLTVTWKQKAGQEGFVPGTIEVYYQNEDLPTYSLDTGVYVKGVRP